MILIEDIEMRKDKSLVKELFQSVAEDVKPEAIGPMAEDLVQVLDSLPAIKESEELVKELSLDDLKEEIMKLSGPDKLTLFNWFKTIGAKKKEGKAKNIGVGEFINGLIFEGYSNKEIAEKCKEKYGNEQTNYGCVVWYRNKMKKEGFAG